MTNPPPLPRLQIRRPEDLLAAVPYLLGFHPTDSAVVVGVSGGRLTFAARADLPPPAQPPPAQPPPGLAPPGLAPLGPAPRHEPLGQGPEDLAGYLAEVVTRQDLQGAVLIGYGQPARVEPTLLAVRAALPIQVYDVLRVSDGCYWSYTCTDPDCCDPAGTRFDVSTSAVAAAAAYAGAVALPDRDALVARVAPVSGPARASMRQATDRAECRLHELTNACTPRSAAGAAVLAEGKASAAGAAVLAEGKAAAREALKRHRAGGALTDDEVAWLTVLLRTVPVRDRVWAGITEPAPHVDLWADVVRRADPQLVAAPASLLAFAAWRAGDGSLAAVALERALDADPSYSMALLLEDVLRSGTPPSILDSWPVFSGASAGDRRRRRYRTRIIRA